MKFRYYVLYTIALIILSPPLVAYKVDYSSSVHQYLTNESKYVWSLMPYEMQTYILNPLDTPITDAEGYDTGDDVVDGSGEEDKDPELLPFMRHFWEPDNVNSGRYSDGLLTFESSWNRAERYWNTMIIPAYLRGDTNLSHYWLGRVAHLLQDITVPAHVHKDEHPGNCTLDNNDDSLECYTAIHYEDYRGEDYTTEGPYYYEQPISGFDWTNVESLPRSYLFRLFWYTSQKTQYFASDNEDGNDFYEDLDDITHNFSPSLWEGENVTIVNDSAALTDDDINNTGEDIEDISDAVVPHAMKATAGLYRLFWDTVHSYEWPTYHHDMRRTGFTLLKGDLTSENKVDQYDLYVQGVGDNAYSHMSAADLDLDDKIDVVVVVTNEDKSWLHGIEIPSFFDIGIKGKTRFKHEIGIPVGVAPTLADVNGDGIKEILIGLDNGTLMVYNITVKNPFYAAKSYDLGLKWSYQVAEKDGYTGRLGFTAVSDLDNDGTVEIVFADVWNTPDWDGSVYVLNDGEDPNNFMDNGSEVNEGEGVL